MNNGLEQTVILDMDNVDGNPKDADKTNAKTNEIKLLPPPLVPLTRSHCNGRFTVVPVREKLSEKFLMSIRRKRPILKRIVTTESSNNNSSNKTWRRQGRANSTPPAIIFCQSLQPISVVVASNDDHKNLAVDSSSTNKRGSSVSSSVDDEGYPSSFKHYLASSQESTAANAIENLNI